jgi:hypothetical protein
MSRASDSITRLDIRFPNEMYSRLQQIAVEDGARTHHISKKVEVSPTVIKLLQFAFDTIDGILPDSGDELADTILGIPDKRIETIVDRRLVELGLFPDPQADGITASEDVSGKESILPDTVSDSAAIDSAATVSDIVADKESVVSDTRLGSDELSDNRVDLSGSISDNENIPSDDSSTSEQVVEHVRVDAIETATIPDSPTPSHQPPIVTDAIDKANEIPQSFSFADFHDWLKLSHPGKRNKANGDLAIATAKEKGLGDWKMDSKSYRFTKTGD